jgi:hypothetical protein
MKGRHLRIWGFVPRRRARLAQCTNAGKPTPGRTLLTAGNSGVLGLSAVASADRQRPKSAHSAIPGAKPVRLAPRRDQRHSGRTNRTARGRRKVRLWFATACPVCTPAQVADDRRPGRGPLPPPGEALDAALIRAHPRNSTCAALRNRQVRNSPSVGDDVGSSDPRQSHDRGRCNRRFARAASTERRACLEGFQSQCPICALWRAAASYKVAPDRSAARRRLII